SSRRRHTSSYGDWSSDVCSSDLNPLATVVVPYSLRARPRATVATPLAWSEIDTTDPDAFGIGDLDRLLDRPDPLAELASAPSGRSEERRVGKECRSGRRPER